MATEAGQTGGLRGWQVVRPCIRPWVQPAAEGCRRVAHLSPLCTLGLHRSASQQLDCRGRARAPLFLLALLAPLRLAIAAHLCIRICRGWVGHPRPLYHAPPSARGRACQPCVRLPPPAFEALGAGRALVTSARDREWSTYEKQRLQSREPRPDRRGRPCASGPRRWLGARCCAASA